MNWFLIALINPIFHAIANHLDKFIISRYLKGREVGALILFTSLFAVISLPIIVIIHPSVFASISFLRAFILMINGAFLVAALIFYFYALNEDEASIVIPFFQLVPIFGLFLGFIFLKETLHVNQSLGVFLVVIGGALLSLQLGSRNVKFKKKLLWLMIGSCFFYAINAVIFKIIAIQQGFLDSLFWDMLGEVICGVILFFAIKSYRKQFLNVLKVNHFSVVGLTMLTETLSLIGEVALIFAILLAPVALVQSVGGLQSFFVFIFGIIITLFLPKFGRESIEPRKIWQKIIGIAVITAGVYFLGVF